MKNNTLQRALNVVAGKKDVSISNLPTKILTIKKKQPLTEPKPRGPIV